MSVIVSEPQNQPPRAEAKHDPERQAQSEWLLELEGTGKLESFFEFEVRLKALDRFLHPSSSKLSLLSDPVHHEYSSELAITNRMLQTLLNSGQKILESEDASALYFQNFVEKTLLSDYRRDLVFERRASENSARESFFFLLTALQHLHQVSSSLREVNFVTHNIYVSLGYLFKHVTVGNRFFDPFTSPALAERFDRIEQAILSKAVRAAAHEADRRAASLIILWCSRILRYLKLVSPEADDFSRLQDSLPVFALVRSELAVMIPIFEEHIARTFYPGGLQTPAGKTLLEAADSIAFQLQMENRKVFGQVLRDVTAVRNFSLLRSSIEAAHGILQRFFQQAVVWTVQAVLPEVVGRDIFFDFISRKEQSTRLREDIGAFHQLAGGAERALADNSSQSLAEQAARIAAVRSFIQYFQSLSFRLVRYSEHDSFRTFFNRIEELSAEDIGQDRIRTELGREMHKFRMFLETTLGQIAQRQELQGVAIDEKNVKNLLEQFSA